jgi:protocatechuate 3,4-dioxygenase beta subunit
MKSNLTVRFIATLALLLIQPPRAARADGPPPTPPPPANVSSVGTIADASEPGTRLIFSGQVFAPDGVTPAPGVFVYAYQTDATGQYHNDPQTRVARLHGWAKTDAQGRFEFRTIHPGAYPGRQIAAHIHFHVWGGGYPLQWTEELLFAGDPFLKAEQLHESDAAGKFGSVRTLTTGADGVQHCTFNIGVSNVTNYPPGAPSKR